MTRALLCALLLVGCNRVTGPEVEQRCWSDEYGVDTLTQVDCGRKQ